MGMGFSRTIETANCITETHATLPRPLKGREANTQKPTFSSNKTQQNRANAINPARYGKMLANIQSKLTSNLYPFCKEFSNEQR